MVKKTVLYVHGFNGNPKGGTYQGLVDFFRDKDYEVISFPFPDLHTDVEKTQRQIEDCIDRNNVSVLAGASLGGFYTLCCHRPVYKIAVNPCMIPSKEIPMLVDRETGRPVQIAENVLADWKKLEEYDLQDKYKEVFGIFGRQDETFHYDGNHNFRPLFEKIFSSLHTVLVDGEHSLTREQLGQGLEAAMKFHREIVTVEGTVSGLHVIPASRGSGMAFFMIGGKKTAVFPKRYEKFGSLLHDGDSVKMTALAEKNKSDADFILLDIEK